MADVGAGPQRDHTHRQLSAKAEQQDREYNQDTCEFIQKALDMCRVSIVEGLDRSATEAILDVLREEETFGNATHITVQDLEDILQNKTTRACLRQMCDDLRRNPASYVTLNSALDRTRQEKLLFAIESIETKYHDELKDNYMSTHYSLRNCRKF